MPTKYETALAALYRAPFDVFVAERKRLSAELASGGDPTGAARLAKLPRPPVSAWVVNQLWWGERKAFDALFRTAERLREPDATLDATAAHRDAVTKLRASAAKLFGAAGKSASEGMLRRVTATLTALAATGGFAPDGAGMLSRDRDAPGFEVTGLRASSKAAKLTHAGRQLREKAHARAERQRAERELERERAQRAAELERLERKLRLAKSTLEARKEEISRLEEQLGDAKAGLAEARGVVRELEKELAKLASPRSR